MKKGRKRGGVTSAGIAKAGVPPSLLTNVVQHHRFRFSNKNSVTTSRQLVITNQGVCGALGGICTATNTTITMWTGSFKIHAIHLYVAQFGSAAPVSASINWSGTFGLGPNMERTASSNSAAQTSYALCKPPSGSTASFWNAANTTTQLFTVGWDANANVILDLDISYITVDGDYTAYPAGVASAVLGKVYYLALDEPSSTANMAPIALVTTS